MDMDEQTRRDEADQDPQPVKESDAERVSGDQAGSEASEIEEDPSQNPPAGPMRDLKGG
jgi:hypothetical protein